MKSKLLYGGLIMMSVGAVVSVSTQAMVLALSDSTTSTTAASQSNDTTSTSTSKTPLTEAQKTELAKRLKERASEAKTKPTAAQQAKVLARCKTAQGNLLSVLQRIDSGHTKRIEVYGATIAKLSPLSEKVKAKNVDTTQLDAEIKMLRQKMDTFTQDAAIFKQTVTDLTVMDCASDPSAFQISLEAARTAQTQVKADAEAISSYVKDTLKPTLVEIRQKLSAASGEENN